MGLYDYLDGVLGNVAALWASQSVDLPALQYVAEGPFVTVAADCDQVVVALDLLTRGAPGAPSAAFTPGGAEWSATLTIGIWRGCVATSDSASPPPAAAHNAAAQTILGDLDLLWRNMRALTDAEACRHGAAVTAGLLEVAGALGGSYLQASIDLLLV